MSEAIIASVEDAAYHCAHAYPGGVESLAPRMGIGAQVLRNKLNPNTNSHKLTLAEADLLIGITGDKSVLHALAMTHGMVCVPLLADGQYACDTTVLEMVTRLWRLGGQVGTAVDETLEDHRVESGEVQKVREKVYSHVAALHELVAVLDGMAE
ncbi:phage regulatory CII family protein [Iodobacter sp. CM08]|uniref:phage regulatory CII family protein n=1 Tax=Iodobacter sp. CM08 TaxID=3085902 RepID=UPI0029814D53|nr:phage regulatory CII family protein [Iodobacter sp. CM08]MDW5417728.1 phage regulatory CII family protein [Iodobacter sp. CM08]